MTNAPMQNVQWVTIAEMAEQWAPQLELPISLVEREIRFALYKIEKYRDGQVEGSLGALKEKLKELPPEVELPSKDSMVTREFIEMFCEKETWALPEFWYQSPPAGPSFPGRPSIMPAIVQELECRSRDGRMNDSLASEARMLVEWAKERFPGQQIPTARTTENGIRPVYHALKKPH